ncbi:alcohol dehydrogenase [Apodospora peruviana]|uniref:Alcohol dehydrogenase n=1 Tax=Apodospora peruviana TaxID=516989 RepID=A0AAE0HZV0_9PEZI|nr:alcohol dehydrogenase [Apodospora peruviana]
MANTTTVVEKWNTRGDGLDKLVRSSGPMPQPGKNEVLVQIKAVSLNFRDTEVIMGLYNHHKTIDAPPEDPFVPCSDMCGVVVAIGDQDPSSTAWKVGDRVLSTFIQSHVTGQITAADMTNGLGRPLDGVLQTYRVFPSSGLVRCPDYLTDEEASCLPIAAVTAWMSLYAPTAGKRLGGGDNLKGKVVLLQGTGGVSIAGLQIAKAAGATVVITSSSDEKLARAKALGADHLINYRADPEWQETVMALTGGKGADVIFETGGAQTLYRSLDCVAFGGLIACIGYLSGKEDAPGSRMNLNLLALRRNVTLKGIIVGPRDVFEGEMMPFYEQARIKPVVDRVFGFDEGKEAVKYLFGGGHFGKVVVRVGRD